jgi:hypothetical protein
MHVLFVAWRLQHNDEEKKPNHRIRLQAPAIYYLLPLYFPFGSFEERFCRKIRRASAIEIPSIK